MTFLVAGVKPTMLVLTAAAAGAVNALVLFALDVGFLKALAIAAVSAIVSGAFLVVATVVSVRAARENRQAIEAVRQEQAEVKQALVDGDRP